MQYLPEFLSELKFFHSWQERVQDRKLWRKMSCSSHSFCSAFGFDDNVEAGALFKERTKSFPESIILVHDEYGKNVFLLGKE